MAHSNNPKGVNYQCKLSLHSVRSDLNLFKEGVFKSIFVEARIKVKDNIIIETICKPPNNNYDNFETQWEEILHKIDKEKKTCILMGGFNIDLLKYEQKIIQINLFTNCIAHTFTLLSFK